MADKDGPKNIILAYNHETGLNISCLNSETHELIRQIYYLLIPSVIDKFAQGSFLLLGEKVLS